MNLPQLNLPIVEQLVAMLGGGMPNAQGMVANARQDVAGALGGPSPQRSRMTVEELNQRIAAKNPGSTFRFNSQSPHVDPSMLEVLRQIGLKY